MFDLVILVGGKGKRLGKITMKTPKPLIKINNNNFLDILLSKLIKYNFKKIFLLCSYKKEKFFNIYHKKKIHHSKIICINEGKPKDTGGALYRVKNKIKGSFFLLNGDSFLNLDLNLLSRNVQNHVVGTMAITNNYDYKKNTKMNNLELSNSGFVRFSKKKTKLMNAGIYFFKKNVFKYIKNEKISLENDILDKLISKNKLKGVYSKKKFIDIGTPKNLRYIKDNPYLFSPKTVFLDRDGVINKLNSNRYVENFDQFRFLPGVKKGIKFLNKQNFLVIIITNQACVGKSIISEKKLNDIHDKMKKALHLSNKSFIDDIFYSPYYKFSKNKKYRLLQFDRKPNPGMLLKAIKKWNLNKKDTFFIGDSVSDYNAAKKIGLKFYYKKTTSLYEQLKIILNK